MDCRSPIDAPAHSPLRTSTEDYTTCTISPSSSSPTSSIFSFDAASSQGSVSSTSSNEDDNSSALPHSTIYPSCGPSGEVQYRVNPGLQHTQGTYAIAVHSRQHPRRTQPQPIGCVTSTGPRPPPSLVRQSERKDNFVEGLVGELAEYHRHG